MTKILTILVIAIAGFTYVGGCSSSDSADSGSAATPGGDGTSFSYNGPGSEWTMSNTGSAYTFSKDEGGGNTITVNATGSFISATGHVLLTVDSASATGTSEAPAQGVQAYAVEIPGTAVILKPLSANSETILTISAGTCPTSDFLANWVIGQRARLNKAADADQDWFGTVNWSVTNDQLYMPIYRSVEDPTVGIPSGGGLGEDPTGASPITISTQFGSCANGKIENYTNPCADPSADSDIYFTSSGLLIVASCKGDSVDQSHIIGTPQVAISATSTIYGNYSGFAFTEGADTQAITSVIGADGADHNATISFRSGAGLATVDSTATVSVPNANLNSPAPGMLHGTFDGACTTGDDADAEADGSCEMVCSITENISSSGRNLVFCVGQSPDDEDKRITMLMVSDPS